MKKIVFSVLVAFLVLAPFGAPKANALSCLPIDMYLKDIVGKSDEIVIFTGTATDQIQADDYTAEVIAVDEAKQGWVENKIFVYHKKKQRLGLPL